MNKIHLLRSRVATLTNVNIKSKHVLKGMKVKSDNAVNVSCGSKRSCQGKLWLIIP